MNEYRYLKERQQQEMDAFPLGFAFSQSQFDEMMRKWGLSPDDTDKIYRVFSGCYVRKSDHKAFHEMLDRHEKERENAIAEDRTGNGYIYQMFVYELNNHEFGYTGDSEDAIDALGLTYEEIENDERLKHGFTKAVNDIMKVGCVF